MTTTTHDVAFTGPSKNFTRKQLTDMAAYLGWRVRSSVCSKTTALIGAFETIENGSRKATAALEKAIPIFSYVEFEQLFERQVH